MARSSCSVNDVMRLVATDGHRRWSAARAMAAPTLKVARPSRPTTRTWVILPRKTLLELTVCSRKASGPIKFEKGENHLFFEVGGRVLISRVIDGQFPAYERVIPKNNDKQIEFEKDRLTSAVKRVALLSNERSRAVVPDRQRSGRGGVEQSGVR